MKQYCSSFQLAEMNGEDPFDSDADLNQATEQVPPGAPNMCLVTLDNTLGMTYRMIHERQSKLLKEGYIEDCVGEYSRRLLRGILGVKSWALGLMLVIFMLDSTL